MSLLVELVYISTDMLLFAIKAEIILFVEQDVDDMRMLHPNI
jgi:hypothetical protein